ncbi:hypothetical protein FDT66_02890 [Polaribacter aestuariivivens]|uniref:Lipoprotein n=1 Tax=Polaribacter aestuariivivens TaxID=2304626 RepID=A0A5S3NFR3_9FLAO|nr:hypothetical protein [Polaribacter aestuariivivens]TMM32426.1 hypothetical protein FDT66_02890 [Polaribacter aestuariivivens]
MKTLKKITLSLAISGLLFTSCDKNSEKEAKTVEVKLENGQTVTYNINTNGLLSFDDWNEFNTANKELKDIENLNLETTTARISALGNSIASLENTIPSWLKTEEVLEDIDDVQKDYQKLLKEKNEPVKNVKQNLEELIEKFDDLREELNETIEDYTS